MIVLRNPFMHCRLFVALLFVAAFVPTFFADANATQVALPTGTIKSPAGFYHPGVLVNHAQLDFVKGKVAAGAEPWKSAFEAAKASELGSLTIVPHPWKQCNCG